MEILGTNAVLAPNTNNQPNNSINAANVNSVGGLNCNLNYPANGNSLGGLNCNLNNGSGGLNNNKGSSMSNNVARASQANVQN